MSVNISDVSKAVAAFENETVALMEGAKVLNREMIELHKRYVKDMQALSDKHLDIITKIATNEETVDKLLNISGRKDVYEKV